MTDRNTLGDSGGPEDQRRQGGGTGQELEFPDPFSEEGMDMAERLGDEFRGGRPLTNTEVRWMLSLPNYSLFAGNVQFPPEQVARVLKDVIQSNPEHDVDELVFNYHVSACACTDWEEVLTLLKDLLDLEKILKIARGKIAEGEILARKKETQRTIYEAELAADGMADKGFGDMGPPSGGDPRLPNYRTVEVTVLSLLRDDIPRQG